MTWCLCRSRRKAPKKAPNKGTGKGTKQRHRKKAPNKGTGKGTKQRHQKKAPDVRCALKGTKKRHWIYKGTEKRHWVYYNIYKGTEKRHHCLIQQQRHLKKEPRKGTKKRHQEKAPNTKRLRGRCERLRFAAACFLVSLKCSSTALFGTPSFCNRLRTALVSLVSQTDQPPS